MLAKNRRIEKKFFSVQFKNSQNSRRAFSPHFLLSIAKNEKGPSLFAFSVSKKICKLAVDRNRLRRQGYSVVGKYLENIPDGFLFFFSFKKSTYPVLFSDLEKEIKELLSIKN